MKVKKTIDCIIEQYKYMKEIVISVIWSVYGECENISVMTGHTGAITELHFTTDGSNIFTSSTDNTLGLWDVVTGQRIKKYKGHTTFVNSVHGTRRGPQLLCSGGDDSTLRMWDTRKKQCVATMNTIYQTTTVCFNDTAEQILSGGIDNEIKVLCQFNSENKVNICLF